MFISQQDHQREICLAACEENAALRRQRVRMEDHSAALQLRVRDLENQIFAVQYPETWAAIQQDIASNEQSVWLHLV